MFGPEPVSDLALVHLVRPAETPEQDDPPLLILLHGIGSDERDLFSFADYLDPRCVIVAVRAPRSYDFGGHSWFDVDLDPDRFTTNEAHVEESLGLLTRFIGEAVERYGADPRRVYLGGFSQGGFMALLTGLSQPQLVAGIVSMSGRLTDDVIPLFAPPDTMRGLPVLMTHGTRDPIIPIAHARHTRDIVQALPVALTYHEYDMVHEVNMFGLQDVLDWVSEQLAEPWHSPDQG